MEWPGLSAALAGFLPLRPDMRHLVPGAEGLIYTPTSTYKYSYINQRSFAFMLVFGISISLSALMWLTSAYDNAILKLVSIRDDIDTVFENWRSPPTKSRLLVHIFNYTNAEAIMRGETPQVVELGPYAFSEQMERVNVVFNPNGTVSFQEVRHIHPLPKESKGFYNDSIWVPNIPYLTTLAAASKADFGVQKLLSTVMLTVKTDLIINVKVEDFIWGMNDEFFTFLKNLKSFMGDDVQPFGFLAKRRGVHHDIVTMKTGYQELDSLGIITHWNGASKIGKWGNTTCDSMKSSDGSMFPARPAYKKEPLYVYAHSMCRRIPLRFNKTTESKDGFPVQQYNVANDMFDYTNNDENKCFSINGEYPRKGTFSSAPCQNGAPIFPSFPHFWMGDPSLREDVLGLTPSEEKHMSYFQIHQRLGVCLLAKTRFQLNIMLKKPHFMNQLAGVKKDKIILPVAWLEYDSGDLKEEFINAMYHLTYTVRVVEELLKWTLLLISLGSLIMFGFEIKKCRTK